jgi:hypothetical protein
MGGIMGTRIIAVVLASTLAGCMVGSDPAPDLDPGALNRGTGAWIKTDVTTSTIGGTAHVQFDPGIYAGDGLFCWAECYDVNDGHLLQGGGGLELHYAAQNGLGGITFVTDHYELTVGFGPTPIWQSGPADCIVQGMYWKAKGSDNTPVIASTHVAVQ